MCQHSRTIHSIHLILGSVINSGNRTEALLQDRHVLLCCAPLFCFNWGEHNSLVTHTNGYAYLCTSLLLQLFLFWDDSRLCTWGWLLLVLEDRAMLGMETGPLAHEAWVHLVQCLSGTVQTCVFENQQLFSDSREYSHQVCSLGGMTEMKKETKRKTASGGRSRWNDHVAERT